LRTGMTRRFRIDIETDSTVAGTEGQERQDATAFIQAITQLIEGWGPMVEQNPILAPLAGELMLFGTRRFRVATSLESVIEELVDKMNMKAGQPTPPPQPSPTDQIKLASEHVKLQGTQIKTQAEIQKATIDAQGHAAETQARIQQMAAEHDHNLRTSQMELAAQQAKHAADLEALRRQHQLDLESAVQSALISHAANAAAGKKSNNPIKRTSTA